MGQVRCVLDWLPPWLAKWKREAIRDHQRYNSKFEQMFSSAKDASGRKNNLASGICATVLKPGARHNLSDHELAWLAATLFTAGYETSSNTLTWSMYFMILFPEIQARAQEQLDQVVGKSRLPTFADAKHLPYIWAIIKEMLRWRPPLPIGIPHATVADDYYEGYFIPKNSIVIPNIWSINRDPEGYDDRIEDFYPERYLDCDGNLKDALDEGHFAFGFGHRSCVGRHVANNTLFVDIATILWAMKIEPVKDAHGKSIVPSIDDERTDGITLHPPNCQFTCTPRFDEVDMILQQARDDILKSMRYLQE
ncbi:cytochrome P450 [Dendrothele bispora CBS 962.96]|uniref:Cytochrome P450 n=1 Tax=Dendrothele bispora (strain CBS 962.96) TaxID=1314807 RepID=A0A4S8KSP5_DENBC|nr:cytochrome P450 [Dendrothele bispora CBS 962.96]